MTRLASSPGHLGEGEKKRPGIHCLRMRQNVPKILVHRKFFSKPLRLRLRNPVNRAQYYYANTWRSDLLISIQIEYGDI